MLLTCQTIPKKLPGTNTLAYFIPPSVAKKKPFNDVADRLKMGDTTDDVHVCIMCLRAIMNNKFGFNMVIQHKRAINCIALSLVRPLTYDLSRLFALPQFQTNRVSGSWNKTDFSVLVKFHFLLFSLFSFR
jgi:hypothetical protein